MTSGYLRGSNNLLAGASAQGGFTIEESLRFNASQSSYLSRTPASAGNRKTWTFSAWVKRGSASSQLFQGYGGSLKQTTATFGNQFAVQFYNEAGGYNTVWSSSAVYRDYSAWYHVVIVCDTTQPSVSNMVKGYVNGVAVSLTATNYNVNAIPQNYDTYVNATNIHQIGLSGTSTYTDGYLTEVNFIDGSTPATTTRVVNGVTQTILTEFGEFDSVTGVWKPAKYTGTYGTNGFYLPMQLDNTVEGFNTVTYIGTGSTQNITGVGFSPDLVWVKQRNQNNDHHLVDSVRGAGYQLYSDLTAAEVFRANGINAFLTDGFSLGDNTGVNNSSTSYVAWCWDAGSSTVSNTDGSITSTVRANPTYGFSVVTYTGNGVSGATVGHGLGVAPDMIIAKRRSSAQNWGVAHSSLAGNQTLYLDLTQGAATAVWNGAPSSTVFNLTTDGVVNTSSSTYVAYCFSEVAGFSKFGSYTGNGSTSGPTITTGFKPAFVMIKRTDVAENWFILDSTRNANNVIANYLRPNLSDAEAVAGTPIFNFLSDGFQLTNSAGAYNGSGGTYIYMAFKDTREYAYWLDDSGNNNDWQPNGGITTESTVTDTPTPYADGGNYAVLNPLGVDTPSGATLNGNLTLSNSASNQKRATIPVVSIDTNKYYWEVTVNGTATSNFPIPGMYVVGAGTYWPGYNENSIGLYQGGTLVYNGSTVATLTSFANGDVISIAFDPSTGKIWFAKNGTWMASGDPATGTSPNYTLPTGVDRVAGGYTGSGYGTLEFNFGQRPFAYTPPTGFKPLHTGNLPDSAIVDGSEYFNAVLYTGNAGNQSITGVGFQPDFVWGKIRSTSGYHRLHDVVRGSDNTLATNVTDAESAGNGIVSFDADGFTMDSGTNINQAYSYVAWNWKANGAGVSNTDGSITSTVSANPTAGFSIVGYAGNSASNQTIGHGLTSAPKMVVHKNRTNANDWVVDVGNITGTAGNALRWNNTSSITNNVAILPNKPTSSVFYVSTDSGEFNVTGRNYIAYCFADVEGYSKFGRYTGNGSSDGVFVYLGFRPAFVIIKRTDASGYSWNIYDSARDTYNPQSYELFANAADADVGSDADTDFLSNGFKLRRAGGGINASGGTYIYMAFAENPFKNSLAR